jgi:AraC-like DNA-binding protein
MDKNRHCQEDRISSMKEPGMYSSRIADSSDSDQFATMMGPNDNDYNYKVTERGSLKARSTLFTPGRLVAQQACESLCRISHFECTRVGIVFLTEPGPSFVWNGAEVGHDQVGVFGPGVSCSFRLQGPTKWASVSIRNMDAHLGNRLDRMMTSGMVFPPLPAALLRLRALQVYARHLAEDPLGWSANPESLHLEQAFIQALLETIHLPAPPFDTKLRQHQQIVIRRFHAVLEAAADQSLDIPEVSRAIGVSSRTLRAACQTQLGLSPTQYLMLRRMHAVRRTLLQADPAIARVTAIATEHGFWEFGRFAQKYRQIFGETPSKTLKCAVRSDARPFCSLASVADQIGSDEVSVLAHRF